MSQELLTKQARSEEEFDRLAEGEKQSRPERLARLTAAVDRLFPGERLEPARKKIVASFHVPQWGDYHNEGLFMDTHLDLILARLDEIRQGKIPKELPDDVRASLQETATKHEDILESYVFLHDISKMDCLLVKSVGEDGKPQTEHLGWEEWQSRVPVGAQGDPVALRKWLQASKVESISYYVPSNKQMEGKKHGEEGSAEVSRLGIEVPPAVLTAIANHEVAYQFKTPKAKTYREKFGSLSEDERDMAMTASFVDTMASLGKDGMPDTSNFLALTGAKRNEGLVSGLEAALADDKSLDPQKWQKRLQALLGSDTPIPERTVAELVETVRRECRPTEWDVALLGELLAEAVQKSQLGQEEADKILTLIRSNQAKEIGRAFGPKMRVITPILSAAEKKG